MKIFMRHFSFYKWNKCLLVMTLFSFMACSQQESETPYAEGSQKLSLSVNTEQWGENGITRASYTGISESSGNKIFTISFQSGDAIGLFAVDKTGKVIVSNQKYTYSGSIWSTETPIEYVTGIGSYTFFAYYPWQESLTGAPALNSTPDITSADSFFASAISSWTPAVDQSDVTKFTAQDLMVAKGTNSMPYFHEVQVSFTMAHQMGLLVTKPTLTYYDIDNPGDTHDAVQSFTTNIPYTNGSYCYFFCKPGVATTLGDKTATVTKGQVWQLYFSNGEPITKFW